MPTLRIKVFGFSGTIVEIYFPILYDAYQFQQGVSRGGLGPHHAKPGDDERPLAGYPYLEREDILQALRYTAWRSDEREVLLASV